MRISLCHGAAFVLGLMLMGCSAVEVGWDIDAGRRDLMLGAPNRALTEFQKIAKLEPAYYTDFSKFHQNVWTYIGRSYYELGDLGQARKALERSVSQHSSAILGHVFLGLVQMRQGEVQGGRANALKGDQLLDAWFNKLAANDSFASYWDPKRTVRNAIPGLLNELQSGNVPWQNLVPKLAQLGPQMDAEMSLAAFKRNRAIESSEGAAAST